MIDLKRSIHPICDNCHRKIFGTWWDQFGVARTIPESAKDAQYHFCHSGCQISYMHAQHRGEVCDDVRDQLKLEMEQATTDVVTMAKNVKGLIRRAQKEAEEQGREFAKRIQKITRTMNNTLSVWAQHTSDETRDAVGVHLATKRKENGNAMDIHDIFGLYSLTIPEGKKDVCRTSIVWSAEFKNIAAALARNEKFESAGGKVSISYYDSGTLPRHTDDDDIVRLTVCFRPAPEVTNDDPSVKAAGLEVAHKNDDASPDVQAAILHPLDAVRLLDWRIDSTTPENVKAYVDVLGIDNARQVRDMLKENRTGYWILDTPYSIKEISVIQKSDCEACVLVEFVDVSMGEADDWEAKYQKAKEKLDQFESRMKALEFQQFDYGGQTLIAYACSDGVHVYGLKPPTGRQVVFQGSGTESMPSVERLREMIHKYDTMGRPKREPKPDVIEVLDKIDQKLDAEFKADIEAAKVRYTVGETKHAKALFGLWKMTAIPEDAFQQRAVVHQFEFANIASAQLNQRDIGTGMVMVQLVEYDKETVYRDVNCSVYVVTATFIRADRAHRWRQKKKEQEARQAEYEHRWTHCKKCDVALGKYFVSQNGFPMQTDEPGQHHENERLPDRFCSGKCWSEWQWDESADLDPEDILYKARGLNDGHVMLVVREDGRTDAWAFEYESFEMSRGVIECPPRSGDMHVRTVPGKAHYHITEKLRDNPLEDCWKDDDCTEDD